MTRAPGTSRAGASSQAFTFLEGNVLARTVIERVLTGCLLLVATSAIIFGGVEALPGDFASLYLGQEATPQAVEVIRRELGLDQPLVERYFRWAGGILSGDFGTSWSSGQPVASQIWDRLFNSLLLAGVAATIAIPVALCLGVTAVVHRNRPPDKLAGVLSLIAVSLPEFFVGYLVIQVFVVQLDIGTFPSIVHSGMTLSDRLSAVVLPVATLVAVVLGHMMRMTRTAILNVVEAPYVETAELKGLSTFRIIAEHAAPNAVGPIVTVVSLNLASLVVGVVVVEVIFVYPGVGQYMVDAVTVRDMPVIQVCGLLFAVLYIGLNLISDIVSMWANPRLRQPK
jgi:peptide/nickel transport system permease protein